ncbi:NACHT domain-containing protein [Microcoleus sp. herbarium14]|uniref:NACHT domain-containing protein n=1 Tax=Microcoleus sp. herbarium14 TaxID=3055439 RepID=UPI002FD03DA3
MKETRKRGIRATEEGRKKLTTAKAAKRNHNGKVWTYLDIATAAEVNETTVKRFFRGDGVDRESAISTCKALGLEVTDIVDANELNPPTSTPKPTEIKWRDICNKVLATQQLRRQATAQQYELNIYVPLGLMERPKTPNPRPNRTGEESQPQKEPELQIVQTYKDDAFFQKVIAENNTEKRTHIAIIGEPGAGKTTLLGKLAEYLPKNSPDFPICIRLADLQGSTIKDYLVNNWLEKAVEHIESVPQSVTPEIRESLKQLFRQGKVWLLLDGVDEMAAESPVLALAKIRDRLTDWVGKARVVLTCRLNVWDAAISNTLTDFDTYKTLEFEPDDVDKFICQWFEQASQDEKRRNSGNETFWLEQGKRLQQELKEQGKDNIRRMVRNPLRLSMLCQSWCVPEPDLPETKAALYAQFTTYFFEWKQEEFQKKHQRVLKETEKKQIKQALEKLALAAMESVNRFRIEQEFAIEQMEEEWFDLADELGWLVLVDRDTRTKKPVYAFFHPTFEEYFAACAIEDWDSFLPSKHKDRPVKDQDNPKQYKPYRIFEPQWKQVILLWLGLEKNQDFKNEKDEFIKTLLEFQDGCQNLYGSKAYFLAIYGIEEFPNCIYTDRIRTVMKSKDIDEIDDVTVQNKFAVSIASSALVLNNYDLMTKTFLNIHVFLSRLLKNLEFNSTKLTMPRLIELSKISNLNNLLREQQDVMETSRNLSSLSLSELFDCLGSNENIWIRRESLRIILELVSQNITKVTADICNFLHKNSYKEIEIFLAWLLEDIELNNVENIKVIVRIIMTINDDCIRFIGFDKIKNIVDSALLQKVVYYLITIAQSQLQIDSNLNDYCYKICLHCAQNLSYPDFYQAWHQDTLTNSATARSNLINLPQLLAEAINDRPDLCNKVKLICIDSDKFGNPENPATKIYNEMRLQGCDKSEDGKPKTMAELQDYWDELRIESEIPLFFICYDSTALSATPTGFSDSFLKALSKFDRAICVVCEPGDIPLQTFSPQQQDLVAAIVQWIEKVITEN